MNLYNTTLFNKKQDPLTGIFGELAGHLCLFVRSGLPARLAKLLVLELSLHLFLVFRGVVVCRLALLALHSEQVILGHRIK